MEHSTLQDEGEKDVNLAFGVALDSGEDEESEIGHEKRRGKIVVYSDSESD